MALSKTNRDGTRQIGGARAWWVVEQFRAASSLLLHFSNLTFLFVVHARNRHDLRSHVLVGNTTLRRRPCVGSRQVQPSMQTTRAPAFLFPLPMTWQTLCCVHTAKLTCVLVLMQHSKRWVWSKQLIVDVYDNWQIAWRCFSASEVQNDHKKRLGKTEAFVSETILFTRGNSACERRAFAPPPWLCISRSWQSRGRASEVHFTLDICDVPRPRPSSYLSLSCVSERCSLCTVPEHEVVLQVRKKEWCRQWWRLWDAAWPANTSIVSIRRQASGQGRGQGS